MSIEYSEPVAGCRVITRMLPSGTSRWSPLVSVIRKSSFAEAPKLYVQSFKEGSCTDPSVDPSASYTVTSAVGNGSGCG